MAEVLAVVASGAGLASLAIQLADGIDRLRKRCENLEKLRDNISSLIDDIEIMSLQLRSLETDHIEILEYMMGPIVLGRCRVRCEDVIKRLETLIGVIPITSSRDPKKRILRTLFESKKWKIEYMELRSAVWDLKLDFIRVQIFQQRAFMQKHILLTSPAKEEISGKGSLPPTCSAIPNPEADEDGLNLRTQMVSNEPASVLRRQARHCTDSHCHCSCHITKQVSRRFWYLEFTPLANMSRNCNNAACTARRHRLEFRTALSQFGISWAVILGLDLTIELGKFSLRPALQLQRVVKYTSPGFVTLWKLSENTLSWEDAEAQFRHLYQSDSTFTSHVDPSGASYLERAVAAEGFSSYCGMNFHNLRQLLELFIGEFRMSLGADNPRFMIDCASFISESRHLDMLNTLLNLGCDFNSTPAPHFESWPKPCPDDQGPDISISIIPPDPFFVNYLGTVVRTNHDFGGTTPLHQALFHGSIKDVKLLIRKSQPLEKNINFLGQTPLHIAVCNLSRLKALLDEGHNIYARDKNGITPLMYAAAMNRTIAVSILIHRGADLFLRDYLENYDFLMYAAVRNNWFLIWNSIEVIESRDPGLLQRTFSRLILAPRPPLFLEVGQIWRKAFLVSVISKMKNMNVCFEDGRTLIHLVDLPQHAALLIKFGLTALNQQNQAGEHSLFAIAKFLDPQLFQLLIEKGADINLKNHKGHSVLHEVIDQLRKPQKNIKKVLDSLDIILSNGADVTSNDNCTCACSPNGCLPVSGLSLEIQAILGMRINNPFWIFEWLHILEEHGKIAEAKANALSVLRRAKFAGTSLIHTCCHNGVDMDIHLNEHRFWDLSSVIKLDRLNDEMRAWEARSYNEILLELMMHLKNNSQVHKEKDQISGEVRAAAELLQNVNETGQTKTDQRTETLSYEIDYKSDELYTSLDMLLRPGGSSLDVLSELDFSERDYTKECFEEYVSNLGSVRGDISSGRRAFLNQLSSVLELPITIIDIDMLLARA